MTDIISRLDITQIFSDVDDFCQMWEKCSEQIPQLSSKNSERPIKSRMQQSEVMTIMIAFQCSGYRTFKDFYTLHVQTSWRKAFPNLVSYTRFVELVPWSLMLMCCFLNTCKGEMTGIAFVDSTPLEVCHPARAHAHKVFEHQVGWGKSSTGWKYGFKLHLIINERGELLAFKLTTANTDDRVPVPEMTQDLIGQLFGDRGYVSQPLFEELYARGLQLVTKSKQNMKQRLLKLMDKILLRKRAVIESVHDQLKNICQIEHSRHRSCWNFLANLISGLIAYTYQPQLPHLDLQHKGLSTLPSAIF
jgi:Transposase DDE domain